MRPDHPAPGRAPEAATERRESVTLTSHWRGHPITEKPDGTWVYMDTGQPVSADPRRACGHCAQPPTSEGHDACLGTLPGVTNACCGHGTESDAYVQLDDGRHITGPAAMEWMRAARGREGAPS